MYVHTSFSEMPGIRKQNLIELESNEFPVGKTNAPLFFCQEISNLKKMMGLRRERDVGSLKLLTKTFRQKDNQKCR